MAKKERVLQTSFIKNIREYSRKYPKEMFLVKEINSGKWYRIWNGKTAKNETLGNPMYDFSKHKVSLKDSKKSIWELYKYSIGES